MISIKIKQNTRAMKTYTFLTKKNDEMEAIYAISSDRIETMNVCDTYDCYGQKTGHYDASDYHFENSESSAMIDCSIAINEKFNIDAEFNEDGIVTKINEEDVPNEFDDEANEDEANKLFLLAQKIQEFIDEWRKENENVNVCKGYTYNDGHNWRTVITNAEDENFVTHEILKDENKIAELNKAIDEKEFVCEAQGIKTYKSNGYTIQVSLYASSSWNDFIITETKE